MSKDDADWWATADWKKTNVEVNRLLLKYFPELREEYEKQIVSEGWEQEGPMAVYNFVFYPFLERALHEEDDDSPLLSRIYGFLSMLANHPNRQYSVTATVGVAEFLADLTDVVDRVMLRADPTMRSAIRTAREG